MNIPRRDVALLPLPPPLKQHLLSRGFGTTADFDGISPAYLAQGDMEAFSRNIVRPYVETDWSEDCGPGLACAYAKKVPRVHETWRHFIIQAGIDDKLNSSTPGCHDLAQSSFSAI